MPSLASSSIRSGARFAAIAGFMLWHGGLAIADETKVNARYDVTLAGIEIGKAALVVDIAATGYTAAASGKITGMAQIVAEGKGSAGARGLLTKDKPQPGSFALTASGDDRQIEIQFAFDKGAVKGLQVTPAPRSRPDKIEVMDVHRRNVLDPMSAALFVVPGTGDLTGPDACKRVLPIFDGVARYDLSFEFLRQEAVAAKGFSGTAAVCAVRFRAIAGHRLGRKDIEYMEDNKDIAVWLVPAAGSRVLVPFKISVATKVGTCVIEAKTFTTQHADTRAAAPTAIQDGGAR
ncbi:MAG: DUF3108 domain-containing protein [Methylacidiphilales bacterium]|nr:DUF3108 domain-containing protein [Candidatus Methylacidiphilales bacterium]